MQRIRLGLVGIGKIARDQHLPAIADNDRFVLAAIASRHGRVEGVPNYPEIGAMIAGTELDAVSLCTPPDGRHELARIAIAAGKHVMLEKPPAASLSEIEALAEFARAQRVALFTSWHSREAAGVAAARAWLARREIKAVRIDWREDIRRWHPGQEWILAPGGFGVFDPGVNALSIATAILPAPLFVVAATMDVPAGRAGPLAAELDLRCGNATGRASFDFLQTGPQTWDIEVDTDAGTLRLSLGGSVLQLPGEAEVTDPDQEYPRLYARFAELVASGASDVDVAPMRLVADAFLLAERRGVEAFVF